MNKREAETRPQHTEGQPYEQDLNPDYLAGENHGPTDPHPEKEARSAFDIKGLHGQLADLTNAELKDIEIMPEGSRLAQGATYIDLRHPDRGEFVARGDMTAGSDNYFVPKSETDYQLWNRLTGVTDPARLDDAGAS